MPNPLLTNIPVVASALVGRETAVQSLQELLSGHREVTLIGPGGIGKTVLAYEVARRAFPKIESDVFSVELASLSDPDLVPSAVARVLSLRLGSAEISPASVARAIGSRKLLLVLDNCEHVVDAAAFFAETILRLCPNAALLATSREVLRIEGELVYRVSPLEVPSPHQMASGDILEHSAVQLFIARMRSLRVDALAHDGNFPAIGAICRRLDGIPLAIEFAAALVPKLGVQQVAARLDDRFALLTDGRHSALPRHQTLRATLDWSYELLPESERQLIRHLAIFPAWFTLDATVAVMRNVNRSAASIAEGISGLVEKSLVAFDRSAPNGRWRLLETTRTYALEKLGEGEGACQASAAHAGFFRDLVTSAAPISGADATLSGLTLCLSEIDNVRAALDWSFSADGDTAIGVALTAAYVPVWLHSALLAECHRHAQRALDHYDPAMNLTARLRLQLYMAVGIAGVFTMRPFEKTRTVFLAALEIAESLDDVDARLWSLWGLCTLHYYSSESRVAFAFAERISAIARGIGDPFALVMADRMMGNMLHHQGDQGRARACLERVVAGVPIDRRSTFYPQLDQRIAGRAMLAWVLVLQGYSDQATEQARRSLEEAMATEHDLTICQVLRLAVCPVALLTGDLVAAETGIAMLVDIANSCNSPFFRSAGRCLEGKLQIDRGNFASGSALLRAEFEACESTGWTTWYPEFLGIFAEGLAGLGCFPKALACVDQALGKAEQGGERYYAAELLRLKGEFLLGQSDGARAAAIEECFYAALAVARQQGALLLELRAALSLARWRMRQHRLDDARQILAPVYARFAEGFDTVDVRAANALLSILDRDFTSG